MDVLAKPGRPGSRVAEGERRRDAALHLLSVLRERTVREAQRALLQVCLERGSATIDDVRDVVTIPDGVNPVCVGASPRPLAEAGLIRRLGYVTTRRPVAHARPVSLWGLTDFPGAADWLTTHPPIEPNDFSNALIENAGETMAVVPPALESNVTP